MPLMYQQNTLQMEWCLNCHRNPAVNLRPTSEIYNMAWAGPSGNKPVWCTDTGKGAAGTGPTAAGVSCTTTDPGAQNPKLAMLQTMAEPSATVSDVPPMPMVLPANYQKFTSQDDLGKYLTARYHIRTANELASCEVCHR
jgi:hypothetical protein